MARANAGPQVALTTHRAASADAARGASLACHSAAGLACGLNAEAARLLRTAEGLARTAAALLRSAAPTAEPLRTNHPVTRGPGDTGNSQHNANAAPAPQRK